MYRPTNLDVILYLRKSRKDIEEEKKALETGNLFDTLQRHRSTLISMCKKENHNIIQIYEEVVSGESITERPQIQSLIHELESGIIDAVLVMDIDRLGRGDMLDSGILDRAFRYSGTKIITPSEVYDPDSETWELVFGIKSLVAREELKSITKRMQRGRRASAAEGKHIGKNPPYGYLRDGNLKLYPDPETAWVVKKIFQMMCDGKGRQLIAQELDRLGINPPTSKRKNWSPSTITAIIKNEVYKGVIIWGQVKHIKQNGKYIRKKLPRERWNVVKNAHEPLVSESLWIKANQTHSGKFIPHSSTTKALSNPLAGILQCEICGYTLLYQPKKDRPNAQIRCVQPQCKGVQKGASLALVENRILQGLKEFIDTLEVQEEVAKKEEQSVIPFKEKAIKKKEKELAELQLQKSKLHDFLERGIYTIEIFMERQQNITERIKKLETEIKQLQEEIQIEEYKNKSIDVFVPKVKNVLDAYHTTTDIEKKNRLLKSVLEKATFLRKIEWTKQDQFLIHLYPKI